jgi:hypothetical protein
VPETVGLNAFGSYRHGCDIYFESGSINDLQSVGECPFFGCTPDCFLHVPSEAGVTPQNWHDKLNWNDDCGITVDQIIMADAPAAEDTPQEDSPTLEAPPAAEPTLVLSGGEATRDSAGTTAKFSFSTTGDGVLYGIASTKGGLTAAEIVESGRNLGKVSKGQVSGMSTKVGKKDIYLYLVQQNSKKKLSNVLQIKLPKVAAVAAQKIITLSHGSADYAKNSVVKTSVANGIDKLSSIKLSGKTLQKGADYTIFGNTITFADAFLQTLPDGKNDLSIIFSGSTTKHFYVNKK